MHSNSQDQEEALSEHVQWDNSFFLPSPLPHTPHVAPSSSSSSSSSSAHPQLHSALISPGGIIDIDFRRHSQTHSHRETAQSDQQGVRMGQSMGDFSRSGHGGGDEGDDDVMRMAGTPIRSMHQGSHNDGKEGSELVRE